MLEKITQSREWMTLHWWLAVQNKLGGPTSDYQRPDVLASELGNGGLALQTSDHGVRWTGPGNFPHCCSNSKECCQDMGAKASSQIHLLKSALAAHMMNIVLKGSSSIFNPQPHEACEVSCLGVRLGVDFSLDSSTTAIRPRVTSPPR